MAPPMVKNYLPNLINKEAIDVNKLFLKKARELQP
jgi:hypothetical protein